MPGTNASIGGPQRDYSRFPAEGLRDPSIDANTLRELAAARPDLWPLIVRHPNCYPELGAFLRERMGGSGVTPQPSVRQMSAQPPVTRPQATQPRPPAPQAPPAEPSDPIAAAAQRVFASADAYGLKAPDIPTSPGPQGPTATGATGTTGTAGIAGTTGTAAASAAISRVRDGVRQRVNGLRRSAPEGSSTVALRWIGLVGIPMSLVVGLTGLLLPLAVRGPLALLGGMTPFGASAHFVGWVLLLAMVVAMVFAVMALVKRTDSSLAANAYVAIGVAVAIAAGTIWGLVGMAETLAGGPGDGVGTIAVLRFGGSLGLLGPSVVLPLLAAVGLGVSGLCALVNLRRTAAAGPR